MRCRCPVWLQRHCVCIWSNRQWKNLHHAGMVTPVCDGHLFSPALFCMRSLHSTGLGCFVTTYLVSARVDRVAVVADVTVCFVPAATLLLLLLLLLHCACCFCYAALLLPRDPLTRGFPLPMPASFPASSAPCSMACGVWTPMSRCQSKSCAYLRDFVSQPTPSPPLPSSCPKHCGCWGYG